MPHIERLDNLPVTEKKIGASIFDAQDPIDALDRQLLLELLSPLLENGSRKSSLMTSGYLAAKAKMATTKELAPFNVAEFLAEVDSMDGRPRTTEKSRTIDDARSQWSRRSSPGPTPAQISTSEVTEEPTDVDDLTLFSSLREELKHHQVQHFCDDQNSRVKWRRRTLIFEKAP